MKVIPVETVILLENQATNMFHHRDHQAMEMETEAIDINFLITDYLKKDHFNDMTSD